MIWNLCLCFLIQLPRWAVPVVYNNLICHSDFTPIMSHWLSISYLMQSYFGDSLTVSTWNSELKLLWCFSGNKSTPWLWQGFLYWPIYLLRCQTVIDTYMNHMVPMVGSTFVRLGYTWQQFYLCHHHSSRVVRKWIAHNQFFFRKRVLI
jgi:hypothetical protein